MIRAAVAGDAQMLAALHAESFGAARWDAGQFAQSLNLPTSRAWIADINGAARGFILCQFTDREAEILTFCVAAAWRRKGLARQLLEMLVDASRQNNIHRIFLDVAVDNHGAIALYQKAGFHSVGKRTGYYRRGTDRVDAIMLSLELD